MTDKIVDSKVEPNEDEPEKLETTTKCNEQVDSKQQVHLVKEKAKTDSSLVGSYVIMIMIMNYEYDFDFFF
eukprot:Pgem_evm1s15703